MMLAPFMAVSRIADIVSEHDTRLWRILRHHVKDARSQADYSIGKQLGVDETAAKRGHDYVSIFVDLDESRVIYATEGRGSKTVEQFKTDLCEHQGNPDNIQDVSCDMSPAFIKGITECFPKADITFDKFHVIKILNEAVDEVCRQEQKKQTAN